MPFEMTRVGPYMRHRSLARGDNITDGAIRLMARGGVAAVTLRTLADEFRISPQAIRQWFGGTEQMWDQIASRFGARWVDSLSDPWRLDPNERWSEPIGVHHLLPLGSDDIAATRAWLATAQLARDDASIGAVLAAHEAQEVDVALVLAKRSKLDPDPLVVDLLVATVRGLRHGVCATQRPMSLARAHAVLDRLVQAMPESPPTSGNDRDPPLF